MRTERADFVGGQGTRLGGRLDLPDDGRVAAYAVFAHCFGCTKNLKSIGNVDRSLTDAGLGILRFDFTGLGDSEGDSTERPKGEQAGSAPRLRPEVCFGVQVVLVGREEHAHDHSSNSSDRRRHEIHR